MTNLYYNTVKMLLERVSSVMVDHDSLLILVGYVEGSVKGTDPSIAEECGKCTVLWYFVFFLGPHILIYIAE